MNDTNNEDEDIEEDIEQCLVCNAPGNAGTDGTFYGGEGSAVFVHAACLTEWRQRALSNLTNAPMIPQLKAAPRRGAGGRMKEQRSSDYAPLDQMAGQTARRIIKETHMDDTAEHWKALKRAYLAGYKDAQS